MAFLAKTPISVRYTRCAKLFVIRPNTFIPKLIFESKFIFTKSFAQRAIRRRSEPSPTIPSTTGFSPASRTTADETLSSLRSPLASTDEGHRRVRKFLIWNPIFRASPPSYGQQLTHISSTGHTGTHSPAPAPLVNSSIQFYIRIIIYIYIFKVSLLSLLTILYLRRFLFMYR